MMRRILDIIILVTIISLYSKQSFSQDYSKYINRIYAERIYKIELLELLSTNLEKDVIPPELTITEDSLISTIKYPEIAKRAGVRGIVIVEFIINKFGNVENTNLISGLGAGCDENTIMTFEKLKFVPAKENDETIVSNMKAKIEFKILDKIKE